MEQKPEEEKKVPDQTTESGKTETSDSGLPKTQEELDALIEKRLARERKKLGGKPIPTEPSAPPVPPAEAPQETADASAQAELDGMRRELLLSKVQLSALKSGARTEAIEDAVLLAMHDAEKSGELTEETVQKALDGVLKRHPEWKQAKEEGKPGGFQVGAPAGDATKPEGVPRTSSKRWNRFN